DAGDPPRLDRPPLLHARRRAGVSEGGRAARPLYRRAREAPLAPGGCGTGYPESDEGDQRPTYGDGDSVRRERGGRPWRRPAPGGPPPRARLAWAGDRRVDRRVPDADRPRGDRAAEG